MFNRIPFSSHLFPNHMIITMISSTTIAHIIMIILIFFHQYLRFNVAADFSNCDAPSCKYIICFALFTRIQRFSFSSKNMRYSQKKVRKSVEAIINQKMMKRIYHNNYSEMCADFDIIKIIILSWKTSDFWQLKNWYGA